VSTTDDFFGPFDDPEPLRRTLVEAVSAGQIALDGVMSPQTKALLQKFGVDRADMTEWWAKTPQSWACPGCGRGKPDLVRINARGELMCRLVEHHDHMGDALEARFVFYSTSRGQVVADGLAKNFAARSASMVSAYDNTIVCNDCNNADPQAKHLVGAPQHLSFSPAEIRRFVLPCPGQAHRIDVKAAKAVLAEILPTFDIRMRFVNGIAKIAAGNTHWFQASEDASNAAHVDNAARWAARSHDQVGGFDALCGTRRPPNSSLSAWRTKIHRKPRRFPTRGEIDHVAHVDSASNWQGVADDWECPGCDRAKVAVIRTNKNAAGFRFTAQMRSFLPEAGQPVNLRSVVCGDCWEVGIALGKEACNLAGVTRGQYLDLVHLSEVRHIVRPQSHGRHTIDIQAADDVLQRIAERLAPTDDEWEFATPS
jgi:rubredoxin